MCQRISKNTTKESIEFFLEDWFRKIYPCDNNESIVRYGYKIYENLTRKEVIKKFDAVCKKRRLIDNRFKELSAQLCIYKYGSYFK